MDPAKLAAWLLENDVVESHGPFCAENVAAAICETFVVRRRQPPPVASGFRSKWAPELEEGNR